MYFKYIINLKYHKFSVFVSDNWGSLERLRCCPLKWECPTVVEQYNMVADDAIWNAGKFANVVHPDFFVEDGDRNPHQSDLEN